MEAIPEYAAEEGLDSAWGSGRGWTMGPEPLGGAMMVWGPLLRSMFAGRAQEYYSQYVYATPTLLD